MLKLIFYILVGESEVGGRANSSFLLQPSAFLRVTFFKGEFKDSFSSAIGFIPRVIYPFFILFNLPEAVGIEQTTFFLKEFGLHVY